MLWSPNLSMLCKIYLCVVDVHTALGNSYLVFLLGAAPPPLHLPSPPPGPLSPNGHRSVGNRSPNGCCWLSMYCERFANGRRPIVYISPIGGRSNISPIGADQLLQLADQKVLGECRQPLRTHPRPVRDMSPTIRQPIKDKKNILPTSLVGKRNSM